MIQVNLLSSNKNIRQNYILGWFKMNSRYFNDTDVSTTSKKSSIFVQQRCGSPTFLPKPFLRFDTRIDEPVGLIHASMEFIFEPSGSSIKFLLLVPWMGWWDTKQNWKQKAGGCAGDESSVLVVFLLCFCIRSSELKRGRGDEFQLW